MDATMMYFNYPDTDMTKPGRPRPGATLRLGNLIFEPQKNDEGTFTFPVHMVQRMEGEPHL